MGIKDKKKLILRRFTEKLIFRGRGGGGFTYNTPPEKIWPWGYISKAEKGAEFSEGQRELNSQMELDSQGLPCFLANLLFLWQHCH